ncbi:hypothetical protein COLO4_34248 [Corchorus olitorius]|uniref:Uncharacterized protein n=1 Tax=Corchorus olitorius TaxID=93759 RepID=A0A1R3GMN7_9ROSI|nr:hypothetical protein COLO4_34248 [Corchorus olitorius]
MAFALDGLIEGFYDPDAADNPEEFVKAVIAYQKKLNSSTFVPKPLNLNQEMENKRRNIV